MEDILELRGLSKQFATHRAVHDVSLAIERGAFFSLLGPSGCGKTTTLRLIAGFEAPTAGEIWLNGSRIDALPPFRRNVNTVFQSYALFPHLTVLGNVEFGLRHAPAPTPSGAFARCWNKCRCRTSNRASPPSYPAESASASLWPGHWYWRLTFYCWMNLFPRSIRNSANRCAPS